MKPLIALATPLAPLLAALLAGGTALAADQANLRVVATNVESDQGKIYVWVYDKKDDWLSDRYRTQKSVPVAGNRQGDRVTLELLPAMKGPCTSGTRSSLLSNRQPLANIAWCQHYSWYTSVNMLLDRGYYCSLIVPIDSRMIRK